MSSSVPPISALVRDPVTWLRSPAALGTAGGALDGDRINDLLRTIAGALGLDDTLGLALPGGFVLTASGSEPLHVDEIRNQADLPIEKVSATLALMELKGMVRQVGGMNYVAVREEQEIYKPKK